MIKKVCFLMALVMLLGSAVVHGESYILLDGGGYASVVEVIDGDSLKVRMNTTSQLALVRLIGVNAKGYDNAKVYLNNTIMGKTVLLSFDASLPRVTENRWNNMYVTCDGRLINEELIAKGYAEVNPDHRSASGYNNMETKMSDAQYASLEMWKDENISKRYGRGGYYYNGRYYYYDDDYYYGWDRDRDRDWDYDYGYNRININVASASDLADYLTDVSSTLAQDIVRYRSYNPFNTIGEIKFVPGMTREIYNRNRNRMEVATNVNTMGARQLEMFFNLNTREINLFFDSRDAHPFTNLSNLHGRGLVSKDRYDVVAPYLSLRNEAEISHRIPDINVNLNTGTADQLIQIGFTTSQAINIKDHTANGYTYKTVGELAHMPGVDLTVDEINRYEDNIALPNYGTFTNINTASGLQLQSAGFSANEIAALQTKHKAMKTSLDIPINVTGHANNITLYTNINKATAKELYTLDDGMTNEIVNALINYRDAQPFGTMDEVRNFFDSEGYGNVYSLIQEFIVLR